MNRIRYIKDGENKMRSMRAFYHEGKYYDVLLNTEEKSYTIERDGAMIFGGLGTSLHDIKIKAKAFLEGEGLVFDEEKREGS